MSNIPSQIKFHSKSQMLEHAQKISALPIKTLKLHQLQIIKNTELERRYNINPNFTISY